MDWIKCLYHLIMYYSKENVLLHTWIKCTEKWRQTLKELWKQLFVKKLHETGIGGEAKNTLLVTYLIFFDNLTPITTEFNCDLDGS